MSQGIEFTTYVPTTLVVNSASPTLAAEVVTGMPISTGAFPGNAFYLTESLANQLSPTGTTFHSGWYAVVQVDSGATAGNIVAGYIGHMAKISAGPGLVGGAALVTSADVGIFGCNPCVFLGAVTPGNYTIVQIAGDCNVFLKSGVTNTPGAIVTYAVADGGKAGCPTQSTQITYALEAGLVGILEQQAAQSALNRVNVAFPFGII